MNFNFSQTIGIYGYGIEGRSLFTWLKKHHAKNVFIFDDTNFLGNKKKGKEPHGQPNSYFNTSSIQEKQEIFEVIFGEKEEITLYDSKKNKVILQKGSRRYGGEHIKKKHIYKKTGQIKVYEVFLIPYVLQKGLINSQKSKKTTNGISRLYELKNNNIIFQLSVEENKNGKLRIISFFSNRNFIIKNNNKKIGEGPHGQPNSYFNTSILPEEIIAEQGIFSLPLECLPFMNTIFRSPGVHPEKILKYIGAENAEKISSATELFLENSPTKEIIGITGTKGKGTTSSLITEILREKFSGKQNQEKQVFLGGNIGTPVFDFFDTVRENDIVVLELSSFQLYDLKKSPHIAVLLRTDTEHLDWHCDTEDYRKAKENIFLHQKKGDTLIYFGDSEITQKMVSNAPEISEKIALFSHNEKQFLEITPSEKFLENEKISGTVFTDTENSPEIFTSEIQLRGKFHQENVLAAIAVAKKFGVENSVIKTVLKKFSGLPMRCELIDTKNGIQFFNDSFSTIPETSISAISILKSPLFLILGGSEKNSDFTELAQCIAMNANIQKIYLIGVTAQRISEKLEIHGFSKFVIINTLEEIFQDFKKEAKSGDSLLLSPGCASFGMFKNYKERGEKFNSLVQKF